MSIKIDHPKVTGCFLCTIDQSIVTLPKKPEHERDGAIDPEVSSSGKDRKHLRPSGKFEIRGHKQASCSVSRKWTGSLGMMDGDSPSWWTVILPMMDTPRSLRGHFPVQGLQSGFYSPARKESSLESFSHGISFEGDRVGVVCECQSKSRPPWERKNRPPQG